MDHIHSSENNTDVQIGGDNHWVIDIQKTELSRLQIVLSIVGIEFDVVINQISLRSLMN
jgi:hypothetical protein